MKPLILHVGMPKTGTTSIQTTLFWNLTDDAFRLLTLDTVFGNQTMVAAFTERKSSTGYFASTIPKRNWDRFAKKSRKYLSSCLKTGRKAGWTPILSAEAISKFDGKALQKINDFVREHGFSPQVVSYISPPLDRADSSFQQCIKTGVGKPFDLLKRPLRMERLQLLDQIFGKDSVSAYLFDASEFPGRCVVRHFLDEFGISIASDKVLRENESLNVEVLKVLHIINESGSFKLTSRIARFERNLIIALLRDLPGRPLRLDHSVTAPWIEKIANDLAWLEQRLERQVPLTFIDRSAIEGIRSGEDLNRLSEESLEWIARRAGHRFARSKGERMSAEQIPVLLRQFSPSRRPLVAARQIHEQTKVALRRRRLEVRTQLGI